MMAFFQTGRPIINMDYMGKSHEFTPEQITAMLLTKLKHTAEEALQNKVILNHNSKYSHTIFQNAHDTPLNKSCSTIPQS